jgi:hypothetical protein
MASGWMTSAAWAVPANSWRLRAAYWWRKIAGLRRSSPRRLRLAETLPLGEHRFVAVVEFESFRFLLGGTPSSLVLLARLEKPESEAGRVDVPSDAVNRETAKAAPVSTP